MSDKFKISRKLDLPTQIEYKERILIIEHNFKDGFVFIPGDIQRAMELKKGDRLRISIQRFKDEKQLVDSLPE